MNELKTKIRDAVPKVSIVLPTYNGNQYLRTAIESCLGQTYKNIELIIVDDCSTDETPDIVASFDDVRIRYVRNEKNQRLPRSLNIGFALTTGEYLTWTSDDNEFLPSAIETMLKCLKENTDVDFVYTDNLAKYMETGETEKREIDSPLRLNERNGLGACFLYTRRVYEKLGGFDPRYELVEDYEYWIRVLKNFKMKHIPEILYIYGEHRKSLKGSRMKSILLFDKILKYQYRYIQLSELNHAVKKFLEVIIDCRENLKDFVKMWVKTVRAVFGISAFLGLDFFILSLYMFISKILGAVLRKFLWPVRKYFMTRKAEKIVKDLKYNPDTRVNVLCAVPGLTMGGSQKVVLNIAKGLKRQGNLSFHAIARKKNESEDLRQAFEEAFDNVISIEDLKDDKLYEIIFSKLIEALHADILMISHSLMAYRCVKALKGRFKDLKIIDILHLERVGATRNEMLWLTPYIDKRVCISQDLKKHMITKIGREDGYDRRYMTIYNGIDLDRIRKVSLQKGVFKAKHNIKGNCRLITFAARFTVEKDPLAFVKIGRDILQGSVDKNIKFIMAGDGYLFEQAQDKIAEYELEKHFILPGMLSNLPELLADTHIFVVVSNNEGIPLTVMETLAMGIPVVSTVVGATGEILRDGLDGYLIPQDSQMHAGFVSKIQGLLADGSLYQECVANIKKKPFNQFTMENMCSEYNKVFAQMTENKSPQNEEPVKNSIYC